MAKRIIIYIYLFASITINLMGSAENNETSAAAIINEFSRRFTAIWIIWQDQIDVDDVVVEGYKGTLPRGGLKGKVYNEIMGLTADQIESNGERNDDEAVNLLLQVIGNSLGKWQEGYSNKEIIFPQGATCVYTLTPCSNIPTRVSYGVSTGDDALKKDRILQTFLEKYTGSESIKTVAADIIEGTLRCLQEWQKKCLMTDIIASGGIAPKPSPIGTGPGMVHGAKGFGGKLTDAYIDEETLKRAIKQAVKDE